MLATAPALALAGCGRREDPAALRFWGIGYEGDYAPHLMTSFTAATGIPVACQSLPGTAAHEKLLTAHAGGALPDVLHLPGGWVGEFAMIGALAKPDMPDLEADLFPGLLDTARYDGEVWAVPWSVGPQMQFYRRDLIGGGPPVDWAGWRAAGERWKRRNPDRWWVLLLLNWWDALQSFAYQAGARVLRERATRANFATPEFREAFGFYVSLFRLGLAPVLQSTEISDPFGAWAQGLFAIHLHSPTLLTDLARRAAELPADRWAATRLPGPDGPGPVSATSASVAIASTTRRPAAARALLRHLVSAQSELRFQQMIGNLPARTSAWRAPQMARPTLVPFAAQLHELAPQPGIVEWERVRIEVQLVAEQVVRGLLTEAAGVAEMDRRVDMLLARRRALVQAGRIA